MHTLNPEHKWVTKLSSAGLVYYHFGQQIIAQMIGSKITDNITKVIYNKVYELFVEEIDAVDNGISTADGELRWVHLKAFLLNIIHKKMVSSDIIRNNINLSV